MSCGPAFENSVTIIYPIRANICQNIMDMSKVGTQQGGGLESHDMVAAKKLNVARSLQLSRLKFYCNIVCLHL